MYYIHISCPGSASPPAAQSSSRARGGNMAGGHGGGQAPPPFQTFGCGKSGKIEVRSTMESRSTEKHLGIGSQANAAGYIALTGLASCKRSKNAYYCTWTAALSAKNVRKIFTFFLISWIAALSAKNVLKITQNIFEKKIFDIKLLSILDEKSTLERLTCNLNISYFSAPCTCIDETTLHVTYPTLCMIPSCKMLQENLNKCCMSTNMDMFHQKSRKIAHCMEISVVLLQRDLHIVFLHELCITILNLVCIPKTRVEMLKFLDQCFSYMNSILEMLEKDFYAMDLASNTFTSIFVPRINVKLPKLLDQCFLCMNSILELL